MFGLYVFHGVLFGVEIDLAAHDVPGECPDGMKLTQEETDWLVRGVPRLASSGREFVMQRIVVIVLVLAFMFISGGYFAVWIDRLTESCSKCKVEETYTQKLQREGLK